jgi:transcriptional regulator with XRE-family HTH domain
VTDLTLDTLDISYAQRVGGRLRVIRRQKGLSLQDVEATSGHEFKASVLGAYERGERAISVPRLYRLARFYGVPVDRLLPGDVSLEGDGPEEIDLVEQEQGSRAQRVTDDTVTIDLARAQHMDEPEIDMLNRYLGMIQLQRQDFNGRMLTIRRDDLRAIACLFQTTQDALRRRLDDLGLRIAI